MPGKEYLRLVLNRVLLLVPVVLGVATLTFVVSRVLPGDPALVLAGPQADQATVERFRTNLGLDKPIPAQYVDFVGDLVQGDLGRAWSTGNTVTADLATRFPASLELVLVAFALAMVLSVPLGVLAAVRKDRLPDRAARVFNLLGVAMPQFWLGLLLIYVLFFLLGLFPAPIGRLPIAMPQPPRVTGLYTVDALVAGDLGVFWAALRQLALPAITLALAVAAPVTRMVRNSMLEALNSDYSRAAVAYGMPKRHLYFLYGLRNALLPVVTLTATLFGNLVGGAIVVEYIFAWPGLGSYAANSALRSDYSALQGFVILVAVLYVLIFLLVDLVYPLIDPRTRPSRS